MIFPNTTMIDTTCSNGHVAQVVGKYDGKGGYIPNNTPVCSEPGCPFNKDNQPKPVVAPPTVVEEPHRYSFVRSSYF